MCVRRCPIWRMQLASLQVTVCEGLCGSCGMTTLASCGYALRLTVWGRVDLRRCRYSGWVKSQLSRLPRVTAAGWA